MSSYICVGIPLVVQKPPSAQYFSNAPGLRDATARREGSVAIENLADAADAVIVQVMLKRQQERIRCFPVAVDAPVRCHERADQRVQTVP